MTKWNVRSGLSWLMLDWSDAGSRRHQFHCRTETISHRHAATFSCRPYIYSSRGLIFRFEVYGPTPSSLYHSAQATLHGQWPLLGQSPTSRTLEVGGRISINLPVPVMGNSSGSAENQQPPRATQSFSEDGGSWHVGNIRRMHANAVAKTHEFLRIGVVYVFHPIRFRYQWDKVQHCTFELEKRSAIRPEI